MIPFLSIIAAILYGVASARLYVALGHGQPTMVAGVTNPQLEEGRARRPGRRRFTLGLVAVAMVLHAWVAIRQTHLPDEFVLPFFTAFAVTALGVVLVQVVLCLHEPADYLGLAVYPLAAVALISSLMANSASPVLDQSIQVHVLVSILANALLALAAAQAILVAVQRHFLTAHRPGGFMRALPPLETTERLLFALLAVGFILLTLSLASGFVYLDDMFNQSLVHKTVLSSLAWIIFGMLLLGRWRFGWRGRRALHWTLAGYAVLILAYFGSKLVLELILHRP